MAQPVFDSSKPHDEYLERKSVDTSGQLGSLYDAFTDNITDQQAFSASKTTAPTEPYICQIFAGSQSNTLISYLKWMDFNDAMAQSVLFDMVKPSGVSSLINHNQSIDDNTRFLYYSYRSKEEELVLTPEKVNQIMSLSPSSFNATHMITKIVWGFEILCVIPFSDQRPAGTVDSLLQNITKRLKINGGNFVSTDIEKRQIAEILNVAVYGSKTCVNHRDTPLSTILTSLKDWQNQKYRHHPLKYTMCSLRRLCANNQLPEFFDLFDQTESDIENIHRTIANLVDWRKHLAEFYEKCFKNFSNDTRDRHSKELQDHFSTFSNVYQAFLKDCRRILIGVRQKRRQLSEIYNLTLEQRYSSLETTELDKFSHEVDTWMTKAPLFERLQQDQIEYIDVLDLCHRESIPMTHEHIEKALQRSLLKEYGYVFIFYANDRLKDKEPAVWEGKYQELISKRRQAAQEIILAYADFTNCQYDFDDLTIKKLTMEMSLKAPRNHPAEGPIPSPHSPELQRPPKPLPSPSVEEINVLLLGETGVGKSTFINAFVNYLVFDNLQQAEQNEPVVLIPVSFLITTGDQFDECTVKFGNVDANENHEHQGQSVTQQCKSYVFHLNEKLILRLIDTPGIGDTRGVAQDQRNMDHILTYVNNLSHLNAVCLLLKPNASRLNVFFRSCINQLFTYLTPIGYNNIIFCFTNARATFFAPGDTGPLLRQMLKKEQKNDIPFEKANTFCFDSESFRYLAARRCNVDFDDFQKQECSKSWTTSVTESVRLLKHIITREPYQLHEDQSPGKAALEISMLARPLMETLRLIVYNWVMCETGAFTNRMILNAKPVDIEICSSCASSQIVPVGPFSLMRFQCALPEVNVLQRHQCTSDGTNFLIEYTVKYDIVAESPLTKEQLRSFLDNILINCNKLTLFLRQQRLSAQDDPFAPVLERFLNEEHYILHAVHADATMNRRVHGLLSSVKEIHVKNNIRLTESGERLSLDEINRTIDNLKSYGSVKKQLDSIAESRRMKMKAYEHLIETNFVKNKTFSKLNNSSQ